MDNKNATLASLVSTFRLVALVCGSALLVNAFLDRLGAGSAVIIGFVGFFATMGMIGITSFINEQVNRERQKRTEELEKKADARAAWDLARLKLEEYFDRNLQQVKMIFYVAIGVMATGFVIVVWGLHEAVDGTRNNVDIARIASAAGIITQFIGLTFMAIYRSTMLQATQYVSVLENINTVGMAVGILDVMKEGNGDLKDVTRVEIVRMLLAPPSLRMAFKSRPSKRASISIPLDFYAKSLPRYDSVHR
jgi:putative ubiquitin-RnfH superfamily antitoxin RatB of RatAB toxin-antitoxin module